MQNFLKLINSNLYALSLYARQIAGTFILFLIARYLTVYDYGLFTSYKAIASFILIFANMGFESYILVSAQNNVNKIRVKIALFLLNALSIIVLTLLAVPFTSLESKLIFILVLIRTFFDGTFFSLILPYFQASRKLLTVSKINLVYAVCITVIAVMSYILKLSLIKFLILNIVLGFINFIQCSYYSKIPYFACLLNIQKIFKYVDKQILSYMLINICYVLYIQTPSLYVSTFIPKEQAALFFSAFTIANIIMILIGAQTQKAMPEFIDVDYKNANKLLKAECLKIFLCTFSIFIFFVFTGKFILKLLYYQDYYVNAYLPLIIFSIGNVCYGIGKIYVTFIMAKAQTSCIWKMQIEAIIICVATLVLFHKLGIYAAAFAYLLSATHIGIRYMHKAKQLIKNIEK